MTIEGPGAGQLTISGADASRIFDIGSSSPAQFQVNISGLVLTLGNGTGTLQTGNGGAIFNEEDLVLADDTISQNA